MLNEGTSIQASICVSVRLVEGKHERPIQSFYGLQTLFCVTDVIFQSLPACQNTHHTCKNEGMKCVSFLELWNGWWANQCICNLMCFVKRKKWVRQHLRLFQCAFCMWEGFVFSISPCVISCITEGQSLSCPLSQHIQVRKCFYGIKC